MSKPRNPRYFPRMKVRGARRRQIAGIQRMTGSFDQLGRGALVGAAGFAALASSLSMLEELAEKEHADLAELAGGDAQ